MREVLNAIFYLLRAGCAWRLLPHDFPKWQTVYLLCATVHSAKRSDHAGMMLLGVWFAATWGCLELIGTDSTFGGKNFIAWVKQTFNWTLEVVKRSDDEKGFKVLPKRWVVERTFSWFGRYRRLSKDYEYLPTTSEMMLYAAMVNLMVRRLA